MKRRTLNTSDSPQILVETRGDLTLSGWDQATVSAETDIADELVMEQSGNAVTITGDRINLRVPQGATCIVQSCGGQATLGRITGTISLGNVGGSLILDALGGPAAPVSVDTVGGEFSAHDINGPLTVQLVGGHAVVADVAGPCTLEQIGGHLELSNVQAGISAQVGGHASLSFDPTPDATYSVKAGGNIVCALPDGANADLLMESPVFKAMGGETVRRITLGEGGPTVHLEASGAIRVTHPDVPTADGWQVDVTNEEVEQNEQNEQTDPHGQDTGIDVDIDLDFEELGAMAESFATDLAAKLTVKLGVLSERLPRVLASAGLSNEEVEELSRQVQESTQRAAEKAQAKALRAAEKATHKAERRIAKARRKAERATERSAQARVRMGHARPASPPRPGGHAGAAASAPATPVTPIPPIAPVTEEERLTILRMLQAGKISVAEAESLLAALEGKIPA